MTLAPDERGSTRAELAPVPLFDPGRGFAPLLDDVLKTVERLMYSGEFTLGRDLREFEERFAAFCEAEHCVGVSDGTTALTLALLGLGVEPGARVVTVPNTFVATAEAIAAAGCVPVFVDADPVTRCMDAGALNWVLDGSVGAVIPVHLYGHPAPMREITAICSQRGVPVLEDAAQAHGATLDGRRAGAWGDAAAFSFYPTKNLGAAGDAGAVVCRSAETAAVVRSLRHHGAEPEDANRHVRVGGTARLDNLQAALLALRLDHLVEENEQRRQAAAAYRELLADLPLTLPPGDPPGGQQVHHLFVVEVEERDRVLGALRAAGIGAAVHYPTPIHLQPGWRRLGYGRGDFPVAERLADHALSLPCFPGITGAEIERVAGALTQALS